MDQEETYLGKLYIALYSYYIFETGNEHIINKIKQEIQRIEISRNENE